MLRRLTKTIALFAFPFFCSLVAKAQDTSAFSPVPDQNTERTGFYAALNDQSPLYDGFMYVPYPFAFKEGSPYFGYRDFNPGAIAYHGFRFREESILYDDYRGEVLVFHGRFKIRLHNDGIDSFSIRSHRFFPLPAGRAPKAGFYELLYDGTIKVWKKAHKELTTDVSQAEGVTHTIVARSDYFMERDHRLVAIGNQKELFAFSGSSKPAVSALLRSQKIRFKRNREGAILAAAAYLDKPKS